MDPFSLRRCPLQTGEHAAPIEPSLRAASWKGQNVTQKFELIADPQDRQSPSDAAQLYNQAAADVFADFEHFFDCTNNRFFGDNLERPAFSWIRNPRSKGALLTERYTSVDGKTRHGITVNSEYCQAIGDSACMELIAFLIVQQARRDLGPEGRNGKRGTPGHIDRWSHDKLSIMGLETFVEDSEDSRELGYGLSVRRIDDGPFDLMCKELLVSGFRFRWRENAPNFDPNSEDGRAGAPAEEKQQTRVRYVCPECDLKALAKPSAKLICGSCNLCMEVTAAASDTGAGK